MKQNILEIVLGCCLSDIYSTEPPYSKVVAIDKAEIYQIVYTSLQQVVDCVTNASLVIPYVSVQCVEDHCLSF